MTTRLRVRWARAAALVALTGGTLAVSAAPATAAPAARPHPERVGGEREARRDGARAIPRHEQRAAGPKRPSWWSAAACDAPPDAGRSRTSDPAGAKTFDTTLVAPKARPGEITGLNISVAVRLGGQNSFDYKMVYVHGPGTSTPGADKPAAGVNQVSGRVRDTGGKAIGGAALTIRDSAGHEYRTTSNRSGRFSITSSAGKTIAEGPITVGAAMDGYRTARTTVRGTAGDVATVRLTLSAVAAPTKTSPSPAAAASPLAAADEHRAETS